MRIFPVIMCGGAGTRLWPASRPDNPKQFLPLLGKNSLFQQTVKRAIQIPEFERLIIIAGHNHEDSIHQQLAGFSKADILLEPEGRDSAAAIAAALLWTTKQDPDAILAVIASDHFIPEDHIFCQSIHQAAMAAAKGRIVTLGVKPTQPTSAYGYIKPGREHPFHPEIKTVDAFVEKPDYETAYTYLKEGYLWNSGNFIFSAQTMLQEMSSKAPDILTTVEKALDATSIDAHKIVIGDHFKQARKISIDYAIMEKTTLASVLPVDLAWSDLGAWDAIMTAAPKNEHGNAEVGDIITQDTQNSYLRVHDGATLATIGIENVAIIAEPDAVLVCRLDQSQSVKSIVETIKTRGPSPKKTISPKIVFEKEATLEEITTQYSAWLFYQALPLWATLGVDHNNWGFHESLCLDTSPTSATRRARVQLRQIYTFALAGSLGWQGPWNQIVTKGFQDFKTYYQRPDGLCQMLVTPDGQVADKTTLLYDQAFFILCLSAMDPIQPNAQEEALSILQTIQQQMGNPHGGFREADQNPFQSNAHMHLFEACLSWLDRDDNQTWAHQAQEIADMAFTKFLDPTHGFIREFFTEDWQPAPGEKGQILEPGHQFEWAWLLEKWFQKSGNKNALLAAKRLYAMGQKGIAPARGVAVDQLSDDLTITNAKARLWPQTERLKAALALSRHGSIDEQEACRADALEAARSLWRYLEMDIPGLWRDTLLDSNQFEEDTVTASSFYHIIAAIIELQSAIRS